MATSLRMILAGPPREPLEQAADEARRQGTDVTRALTAADALALLRTQGADLLLAEVALEVPALLAAMRAERINVPVLACGVESRASEAVAAVRAGAIDYVPLPPSADLIAALLLTVGERRSEMLGSHPAFLAARDQLRRLTRSSLPLLIRGESGTGKELLARVAHQEQRRTGPFISIECAGASEAVTASELFGHAAGDFPGAIATRAGKLVAASGGTLLIRNIDALSPALQARLMPELHHAGVRIMATTAADLRACLAAGSFRADLLNALTMAAVDLPPLRMRRSDIPDLAGGFASHFARREGLPPRPLSPDALDRLQEHDWPGNVRELEQLIYRAVLLAEGSMLSADDLVLDDGRRLGGAPVRQAVDARMSDLVGQRVEDVERQLILQTLGRCGGNRTTASAILGISVRTMRNKLRSFKEAGFLSAGAI